MRAVDLTSRDTATVNVVDGALQVVIVGGGAGGSVAVDDITDAGTTGKAVLKAANGPEARTALGMSAVGSAVAIATDAAAARTAIGAGTGSSNLALGTTATTAKAGDYAPTWAQVTGKPTTFAPVPATASVVGGVKQGVAVADGTASASTVPPAVDAAADLAAVITAVNALITCVGIVRGNATSGVTQVNALLAALRTATTIAT